MNLGRPKHTSSLAQLLERLGQWSPAQLLELLPALHLTVVIDLVPDVSDAPEAIGVSERSEGSRENGSGTEPEGKTSPWHWSAW